MARVEVKEDRYLNFLRFVTGFEFDSRLSKNNDIISYSAYFRDGSEYHVKHDDAGNVDVVCKGLAAKIYKAGIRIRASLCN